MKSSPLSLKNSQNRKAGAKAEDLVRVALEQLGLSMIERRETGWGIIRKTDLITKKSRIVGAYPMAKVSGDFTAVGPGARYVHVEVKSHSDPDAKLSLSDFQSDAQDKHQLLALDRYAMLGCLTLVAWAHPRGLLIMLWPIDGLAFKKPIGFDEARRQNVSTIATATGGLR